MNYYTQTQNLLTNLIYFKKWYVNKIAFVIKKIPCNGGEERGRERQIMNASYIEYATSGIRGESD